MAATDERSALVNAIAHQVQELGLLSERIGHGFAAQYDMHSTDFRASALIFRAELAEQPLSVTALAQALDLSVAATTYVVDRLVAAGHVERHQDLVDRRRVVLRFAPQGRAIAGQYLEPMAARHGQFLAGYTTAELTVCLRFLDDVYRGLGAFDDHIRGVD